MPGNDKMKPAGVKLTYDDFLLFPDDGKRHELIDGEHYVTPSPNTKHQTVSMTLAVLIRGWLEDNPIGHLYHAPFDVVFSRFDVVEPDLLYLSNDRAADVLTPQQVRGTPDLVIIALRARTIRASSPLPPSEQTLLGGSDSLRGYRAGYVAGDGIAASSAELRVPFTSPLDVGRFGVKAFVDTRTAWPAGASLSKRHFEQGTGAGIYFGAAVFNAGVDVAWPRLRQGYGGQARHGSPRWHFGLGVTF